MKEPSNNEPVSASVDWHLRTRLVIGSGCIERVGMLAGDLGASRVLLVTDPGIVQAGHSARVKTILESARLTVTLFDQVKENPTTKTVDACVEVARKAGIDLIVGLGGGSSMDTAKGCNFLLTNGGRIQDYWGIGKATKPMLPLIAIPTTAGTGSECQSFALIADEQTHQKMACGDPKAAPKIAILDPLLTLTQPRQVAAITGLDAVAHAVETAVTRKRNAISWLFSREAFRLTSCNLPIVLEQPDNIEARADMQLGAAYAGIAIENSMLGAAHSAANPLTARHGILHGHAVGMMLPHVVRFNAERETARGAYAELANHAALVPWTASPDEAMEALLKRLDLLISATGIPRRLSDCGVSRSAIPQLASEASKQWTAQFNPREIGERDFETLYNSVF